jgi:hypothetical protein
VTAPSPKPHFGAYRYTPGTHSAGWCHPDAISETDMSFGWDANTIPCDRYATRRAPTKPRSPSASHRIGCHQE